ncbi:MAG: hypothetical protein J0I09_14885 [Sphingobacteriia bacterium]|nr:hypothetical protein [Sphingobacteriia bacterium]
MDSAIKKELWDDGDLNWLDYGFRNYDPQIGRFVQIDPLTDDMPLLSTYQYGALDPIGNIDEDGLAPLFSFCAGTSKIARMIANTGEFLGKAAGAIGSISNITTNLISNTLKITTNALAHAGEFENIGKQANVAVGNMNVSSGSSNTSGNESGQTNDKTKCNCPDGYSDKPKPGGDPTPYFFSADEAANYWSYKAVRNGLQKGTVEYSSEIRSLKATCGGKSISLLYTSSPVKFNNNDNLNPPKSSSPGIGNPLHSPIIKGHSRIGLIHLHWEGSDYSKTMGGESNKSFSRLDLNKMKNNKTSYFYVLGSSGELWAQYPAGLSGIRTSIGGYFPDTDEEGVKLLNSGFYNQKLIQPILHPCYKQ